MIVIVATKNPMKVSATRKAFARFYPKVKVNSIPVSSSISSQPVSFGEIVRGARERARKSFGECDFSVGIEAGTFRIASVSRRPFMITMACVFDGEREALGSGPFFEAPTARIRKVVRADTGTVARVTRGKVTRGSVTRDAVVMALAPFIAPGEYPEE